MSPVTTSVVPGLFSFCVRIIFEQPKGKTSPFVSNEKVERRTLTGIFIGFVD